MALQAATESPDPGKYWRVLKTRLKKEGNQSATNCSALKLTAQDVRKRLTDVADAETLLRMVQSVYTYPQAINL
jgi:hypothetical protein